MSGPSSYGFSTEPDGSERERTLPLKFDRSFLRSIKIPAVFNDFAHEPVSEKLRRYGNLDMVNLVNETYARCGHIAPYHPLLLDPFNSLVSQLNSYDLRTVSLAAYLKLCPFIPNYGFNDSEVMLNSFNSFSKIVYYIQRKYNFLTDYLPVELPPNTTDICQIRSFRGHFYSKLTFALRHSIGEPFPGGYASAYCCHPSYQEVDKMLTLTNIWILHTIAIALESKAVVNLAVAKLFGITVISHAPGFGGTKRKIDEVEGRECTENSWKLIKLEVEDKKKTYTRKPAKKVAFSEPFGRFYKE